MNRNANGRAGGAQTGCQRAAARLCPTCLFLPCGVRLCTISLLQVFLSLSISSGWTTAVTFSLPSFHQTDPRSLESKMEFRDQHFWSNNVNIDAKNSPPRGRSCSVARQRGELGRLNLIRCEAAPAAKIHQA